MKENKKRNTKLGSNSPETWNQWRYYSKMMTHYVVEAAKINLFPLYFYFYYYFYYWKNEIQP